MCFKLRPLFAALSLSAFADHGAKSSPHYMQIRVLGLTFHSLSIELAAQVVRLNG